MLAILSFYTLRANTKPRKDVCGLKFRSESLALVYTPFDHDIILADIQHKPFDARSEIKGVVVSGPFIYMEYFDAEVGGLASCLIEIAGNDILISIEDGGRLFPAWLVAVVRKYIMGRTAALLQRNSAISLAELTTSTEVKRESSRLRFIYQEVVREELVDFALNVKGWDDWLSQFLDGSASGRVSELTRIDGFQGNEQPRFTIQLHEPRRDKALGLVPGPRKLFLDPGKAQVIQSAINWRRPILLEGEPGTGKTTLPAVIAYELGMRLTVVSCSGNMDEFHLQGYQALVKGQTVTKVSQLVKTVQEGGVLHLDEFAFLHPEAKAWLASLLDHRRELHLTAFGGEVIKAHPDLIIIASQNPDNGRFGGQHQANEAWNDRFLKIEMDYLSPEDEVQLLLTETPQAEPAFVRQVVQLANQVRGLYRNQKIDNPWTPRAMTDLIRMAVDGVPLELALKYALVDRLGQDETQKRALADLAQNTLPGVIALAS